MWGRLMAYARPRGASRSDFQNARAFELQVGTWLGEFKIGNLDSPDRLDWWVPGPYIDVKEKRLKLGQRWHLLPGVPEVDLFVIDELAVRKAAKHFPHAYFVIRDLPGGERIFLARVDEMFSVERKRVNRVGSTGHAKGKWIVSLQNFRQLTDPATQLLPTVLHDQQAMPWKYSHCVTQAEVPEV
jgi:hypothetical protein